MASMNKQRRQVRQRRQADRPDAHAGERQQLAVVVQVRREEDHQQDLQDLGRLEVDAAEPEPEPRAAAVRVDAEDERREDQRQPERRPGVAVLPQPGDARAGSPASPAAPPTRRPTQIACRSASSGSRRATITMLSAASIDAVGSTTWSARGYRRVSQTWTANSAVASAATSAWSELSGASPSRKLDRRQPDRQQQDREGQQRQLQPARARAPDRPDSASRDHTHRHQRRSSAARRRSPPRRPAPARLRPGLDAR